MVATIAQYILYATLFITIFTAIVGLYFTVLARKGYDVDLELPLMILHIVAATAPYIGLFGTVWHIIQALQGIAGGELSVGAISQPIGAALFTTLWGLGCAIPALVVHRIMVYLAPEDTEKPVASSASAILPAEVENTQE